MHYLDSYYRSYLVDVQELKITEKMADQMLGEWYTDGRYFLPRVSSGILPALEVVVWPYLDSEWPANTPREICETVGGAAARWYFSNPALRIVLAPVRA